MSSLVMGDPSRLAALGIAIVVIIAFGSYFAVQTLTENNVRQALLEKQKARQIDSTAHIADKIETDLRGTVKTLQLLASHPRLQQGDLASEETGKLLQVAHAELSGIALIHNVRLLDEYGIHVNNSVGEDSVIGLDASDREYFIESRKRMQPYVSSAYASPLGDFVIAVAVPIINQETGEYRGIVAASFPTVEFFQSFEIQGSGIVAFDRKQAYVATTIPEFLGLEYWGERVQTASRANPVLNAAYTTLFSGEPTSAVFVSAVTNDERFISGSPVFYQGEQVMSVAMTTPTASIYSEVNEILLVQKTQTIVLITAVVAAISILILYLSRWNRTLEARVEQRTEELRKANEKLQQHDKMQKEFINIAAHELRTPVQPILGVIEMLELGPTSGHSVEKEVPVSMADLNIIARNAARLERLSSDILDVARIDSQSLRLERHRFDVRELVADAVEDGKKYAAEKGIVFTANVPDQPVAVDADRQRLMQVLTNLIGNAIRFTRPKGQIWVELARLQDRATVAVSDEGSGIDPDVMPKLFTKFTSGTLSGSGTGLGLYISKAIVEAHGGDIRGENNPDGKGARFTFTLPAVVDQPMPAQAKPLLGG